MYNRCNFLFCIILENPSDPPLSPPVHFALTAKVFRPLGLKAGETYELEGIPLQLLELLPIPNHLLFSVRIIFSMGEQLSFTFISAPSSFLNPNLSRTDPRKTQPAGASHDSQCNRMALRIKAFKPRLIQRI